MGNRKLQGNSEPRIVVSEVFLSLQGEGPRAGVPAVFLRLAGCNLMCGGVGTDRDGKLHRGATWRCDTIEVWQSGEKFTATELLNYMHDSGHVAALNRGAILVITGGEPLLQAKRLPTFLALLHKAVPHLQVDFETNGTLAVPEELERYLYVVSPKGSNSGTQYRESTNMRVLSLFARMPMVAWKFVAAHQGDCFEVLTNIITPLGLNPHAVWFMPAASNRKELEARSEEVADFCINRGFNFSTRLQVAIWNETTGV